MSITLSTTSFNFTNNNEVEKKRSTPNIIVERKYRMTIIR